MEGEEVVKKLLDPKKKGESADEDDEQGEDA
jgi:hypothetical protein